MLEVKDLAAAYSGIEALRGVSLKIEAGEMVALIGANGAGKSTLLNCLSGTVRPRGGSIRFEGKEIAGAKPHKVSRQGLLHVPEGRQILVELTIEENLLLGELARGGRPSNYGLKDVYKLFPILEERRLLKGGTLSGGQQQMLAIGRALMGGPRLLLLDEPSLGLSPLITDQVFSALQSLNAAGLTILLVEQNAHRALQATSRAYLLEHGEMAFEGRSADLINDEKVIAHYLGHLA
ncbi:MAG: ABC transporter ATP-binding protein [Rhodoferax sp.]|jgi:branched-chain amino acid transport system ATP-binding protein|nr:ABC transporter ATP-binding protein [Rhodoferax sp.]